MTTTGRPDVAIIGGGVMGCALAYYLARAGESVMLLEQSRGGSVPSASGASAAIVNLLVTAPDALLQQSLLTHKLLPELAADLPQRTGIDIGLTRPGSLRLAFDDKERPGLERLIERFTHAGIRGRMAGRTRGPRHRAGNLPARLRRCLRAGHLQPVRPALRARAGRRGRRARCSDSPGPPGNRATA